MLFFTSENHESCRVLVYFPIIGLVIKQILYCEIIEMQKQKIVTRFNNISNDLICYVLFVHFVVCINKITFFALNMLLYKHFILNVGGKHTILGEEICEFGGKWRFSLCFQIRHSFSRMPNLCFHRPSMR